MRKRPYFLPLAILITTLTLGISVPAFFIVNRSGQASFSEIEATPTAQAQSFSTVPQDADIEQTKKQNCIYNIYHWINQPQAWPAQVTLGGVTYTRADMLYLYEAPEGDLAIDLVKETLVAIVNIYNGASQARIEGTLLEADEWLSNYQADGDLSEFNQQQARSLKDVLASYNNGLMYPATCADQIPSPADEIASETEGLDSGLAGPANQAGSSGSEENITTVNSTVNSDTPAAQPTQAEAPPARAPVQRQRPVDTPIPPKLEQPPLIAPPDSPPSIPDPDDLGKPQERGNPDRGNSNGNGNGNGKGNGKGQGQGNDDPGQGNQGKGKDDPGQGNQGKGKDDPGQGNQGKTNDDPGQGNQEKANQREVKEAEKEKEKDKEKDKDQEKDKDKDKDKEKDKDK